MHRVKRTIIPIFALLLTIVGCLVGAGLTTPARAAEKPHRAELLLLLSLIDQVPSRADLARARVSAQALYAAVQDASLPTYLRARAAGLLGHFDNAQTRRWLRRLVTTSDNTEVQLQALANVTHLEGRASQPLLEHLLRHRHPELRAAASRGLVRIKAPDLASLVQAQLQVEKVSWVRRALSRAMTRADSAKREFETAPPPTRR